MTDKTPDEVVEEIEATEEAGNIKKILELIDLTSSEDHGGDDDWAEAAEASLDAFYRLIKAAVGGGNNSGTSAAAAAGNTPVIIYLSKVFASLKAWKKEEAIVEVALGCIVAIASKATTNTAEEEEKNSTNMINVEVELVLDVMKEFTDESTIQEQACLAIEGLALWPHNSWKDEICQLNEDGVVQQELKACLEERITNERNKAYPVRAAKALGIDLD